MYYREEDSEKWNSEQIITENYNEEFGKHRGGNGMCRKLTDGKSPRMCNSLAQTYKNTPRKDKASNLSVHGGQIWKKTSF